MQRSVNAQTPAQETPLSRRLASRMAVHGPLTFAEYMEACLYDPTHGYYSRPESTRFADYYTSVDVHPIFGRLLARQLAQMWDLLGKPRPFLAVEAGAGVGRLAAYILDFAAARLPDFYAALRYVAVERAEARRSAQALALGSHVAGRHAESRADLPEEIAEGCIFSNELFDAMPVHRVVCLHGELREYYVNVGAGRVVEELRPLSSPAVRDYFTRQGITLQEGQQAEAGVAACRWMQDAARRLGRGFVLSVDYGHDARELYGDRHMRGTALAYRQHRANEDYYAAPGEQDLTAHVNFTALELCGRESGLETAGRVSQSRFLLALGRANDFDDLYEAEQNESERMRARQKLTALIHPEGMGETFQVLIQQKGIAAEKLTGLEAL
jgi:SAM-dependent MidA family methyltransferase